MTENNKNNDNIKDDCENKEQISEEMQDEKAVGASDDINIQKIETENVALGEKEEPNPWHEKKADIQKDTDTKETAREYIEIERNAESAPKYSSSYSPPYYVPNFTVSDKSGNNNSSNHTESAEPKKKRGWLVPVIVLAALICIAIIGAVGMGVRHIIRSVFDFGDRIEAQTSENTVGSFGDETVTITKNDGSIEIDSQLGSTGYTGLSVTEITALVADSVVEINTSLTVNTFYGQYITGGAGSGVIIGEVKNGNAYYIVTNHHVIDGAEKIKIRLRNGDSYEATLVGSSEFDDIALLRIVENSGKKLTVAKLGSSANLKVGDGVVAIGNPLGTLGGTVTDGIISALDREIMVEDYVMRLLQTNAAINPGNSGGGLFNSAGELVGVVNAKRAASGIEGLGFAVPVDRALDCVNDILEYGYVKGHPSLGVKVQKVSLSSGLSSSTYVQVTKAVEGSALEIGDVIYSVNGETVSSVATFNASVYQLDIGDEVVVQVIEKNAFGQNLLVSKTVKVVEHDPGRMQ